LYEFHYTLHLPALWGVWLMGVVALAWFLDCFVGFYLTLPRARPLLRRWRTAWKIRRHSGAYRFQFDLHRAGGLWAWGLLAPVALSGFALNLHEEVFEPVVSSIGAVTPDVAESRESFRMTDALGVEIDFDRALALAREDAVRRGWTETPHSIFRNDAARLYGVNFGGIQEPGLGLKVLYVDMADGTLVGELLPGNGTAADLVLQVQFPIHSGRIIGLPGRILVAMLGVFVCVISFTGIVIWNRKRRARLRSDVPTRPVRRPDDVGRRSSSPSST
jgi:uncharacterized iron-regulated membrane protein